MRLTAEFFLNFLRNKDHEINEKSDFIFYKIVDYKKENKNYVLQCINTKACFELNLIELVFDIDILYGLHPIQSCYVGIELGGEKETSTIPGQQINFDKKLSHYRPQRYGEYALVYKNREGNICFINKANQEFVMDPRDIALSSDLISEFDAVQAFFIGYEAGSKMCKRVKTSEKKLTNITYLRLVQ